MLERDTFVGRSCVGSAWRSARREAAGAATEGMRKSDTAYGALAIAAALLVCSSAYGQATVPKAPAENGIKMGEGRVHPYFDLELRFDSAALAVVPRGAPAPTSVAPEAIGHFRPGFRLEVPSSFTDFSLNANVDYVWYTGLLSPNSNRASRLEAGADLAAVFNKSGAVSFELGDRFSRSDRTTNAAVAVGVISLFNEVRAALSIRPGGGALEVTPSGAYALEFFSPIVADEPGCGPQGCSVFNYQNIRGGLAARYRFLPKTALILDATYDVRSYFAAAQNQPAQLLKAQTGLAGLISPKIALLLKAGWAQDFVGAARTVVGHAELSYLINDRSNVKFGYLRSIEPVPIFGSFGDDRGYVETNLIFAEKMRVQGYAAFDYLSYYSATNPRRDTNVTFSLSPEYSFTRWFKGAVAYTLTVRSSDRATSATLNFTRHEGLIRATFQY